MNQPCLNEIFKVAEDKLSYKIDGFNDLNEDDVYPTVLYRIRIPIIAIQQSKDTFTTEKDMYEWVHLSNSFDHIIVNDDDDDVDEHVLKGGGKDSRNSGNKEDVIHVHDDRQGAANSHYNSLIDSRSVSILVDTIIQLLESSDNYFDDDDDDHGGKEED